MKKVYDYACDTCASTKTIVEDTARTGQTTSYVAPGTLPCGWRGCEGTMSRVETKEFRDREQIIVEWSGYMSTIGPLAKQHPSVGNAIVRNAMWFLDRLSAEDLKKLFPGRL